MKVNIGCGKLHKPKSEGWTNIDIIPPADIVCDVTLGIPLESDSVDELEADNIFEHFDNDEFQVVMNECWRIIKPGGTMTMKVPDALRWPDGAFGDPTHKRFFVPRSFLYFTESQQWKTYGQEYGFHCWRQQKLTTDQRFFTWIGTPKKC